jgi:serine/threonine-protein kinase
VLALGGALLLIGHRAGQAADEAIGQGLAATQAAIEDALAGRSETLLRSAELMAQVPQYISRSEQALLAESRSDLLDQANEFQRQGQASWAMIVDGEGSQQAWTRAPGEFDVPRGGSALVGRALGGENTGGFWLEPTAQGDSLFQAVAVPLQGQGGVVGALILAVSVDSAFAARLRLQTASEVVFFALDSALHPEIVASTFPAGSLGPALGSTAGRFGSDSGGQHLRVRAQGQTWIGALGPLRTAAGTRIGDYAGLRSREAALAPFTRLRQSILLAFIGALLLASLATWLVTRHITKPLQRLVEASREAAQGRYLGEIAVDSQDEIGELARAFGSMLAQLREQQRLVEFLSGGGGGAGRTVPLPPNTSAPQTGRLLPGQSFAGRYEIKQVLGAGGMGVVYRAWDRELEEAVAIKTLHPQLLGDATLLERFKQEIRLARRISHPNVVRTHDLGEVDGTYFITMEYVEGTPLDSIVAQRGALPTEVVLTIGKQLCRALEVAHAQGVVHRDIKPQNLVVDARGFLKVMDFGIARLVEGRQVQGRTRTGGGAGLTAEGTIIGTPEYMAPEQLLGHPVDGRADLYAAGAVLFECATGRRLFEGNSFATLMLKQVQEPAPDPRTFNPGLPDPLSDVILRALAKEREARWQSAEAMYQALERIKLPAEQGVR